MNNLYVLERIGREKLEALRTEGIQSQMLAQELAREGKPNRFRGWLADFAWLRDSVKAIAPALGLRREQPELRTRQAEATGCGD